MEKGFVKAVTSGDSITISTNPKEPLTSIAVVLAGVRVPKLGITKAKTVDEPFAFHARMFLRERLIGKVISYRKIFSSNNRHFCVVFDSGFNVNVQMIKNGFAKVGDNTKGLEDEVIEEMKEIEGIAKAKKIGIWTTNKDLIARSVRVLPPEDEDKEAMLEKFKDKEVPGIVEFLVSQTAFILSLFPSHHSILFSLAGITCPQVKRNAETGTFEGTELGLKAYSFVEMRLLNRKVGVVIRHFDKSGIFYGVLRHPEGDIRVEMLRNGYAQISNWTIHHTLDTSAVLRRAEKDAKEKRLNLWKDFSMPDSESLSVSGEVITGKVIEVSSGDTMCISTGPFDPGRFVTLVCTRAPRISRRYTEPWARESRNCLIDMVIGRKVKATMCYRHGVPIRDYAIVELQSSHKKSQSPERTNLGEMMIRRGFASLIKPHPGHDYPMNYDFLLSAEKSAKSEALGMYSAEEAPSHRIGDLNDKNLAHYLWGTLSREESLVGTVEYVISGSSLRVYFPKHNCISTVLLAGIKGPEREGEYADESINYARNLCMNRDVEVIVEGKDKRFSLISSVIIKQGGLNLAVELLKEGLVAINQETIYRARQKDLLFDTAKEGMELGKRMLSATFSEITINEQEAEKLVDVSVKDTFKEVTISEITGVGDFFLVENGLLADSLNEELQRINPRPIDESELKMGSYYVGFFTGDNHWNRIELVGVVEAVDGTNMYLAKFIDFGNTQPLSASHIAELPLSFSVESIKPLAIRSRLASVRMPLPSKEEFGVEAVMLFKRLVWEERLIGKVEYIDVETKSPHWTLAKYREDLIGRRELNDYSESVSAVLVRGGLAAVRRDPPVPYIKELDDIEMRARSKHINIWRDGFSVLSDIDMSQD